MNSTRTTRLATGVALGFANHLIAMVVGLWLTRFLLERLGQAHYGLWLAVVQLLGWLALADLGVVGLLPRDIAADSGASDADARIRTRIGVTARVIAWQLPLVLLLAAGTALFARHRWPTLAGPLAIAMTGYVLAFPLRLFPAVLHGLQDFGFLARNQLLALALNTLVVVGLVSAGTGLYALAAGWSLAQILPPLACAVRLARIKRASIPDRLPPISLGGVRIAVGNSIWVSLSQVSVALSAGSDILVIGFVLSPEAAVPYAVTSKLMMVLSVLTTTVTQQAMPGLSQVRAAESPERIAGITRALVLVVLTVTGATGALVMAVNGGFVTWWLGAEQYAGPTLTALVVMATIVKHFSTSLIYAAFAFGHERMISLVTLMEGIISALAMLAFVHLWGIRGAPVGQMTGIIFVTIPVLATALGRDSGRRATEVIGDAAPWLILAAVPLVAAAAAAWRAADAGLATTALLGGAAVALYGLFLTPLFRRSPLDGYARQVFTMVRAAILPAR